MSFPRAKLKRFNETFVPTPSPAQYNVDLKDKPKLAIIPQGERFVEICKSPASSESGSVRSTPCFKTPTLLSKKKPNSATKLSRELSNNELLNQKIVECKNKDSFIKELNEQIEEIKEKLFLITNKKEELEKERQKYVMQTENLEKKHEQNINNLKLEHKKRIEELSENIKDLNEDLVKLKDVYSNLRDQVKELNFIQDNLKEKYIKGIEEKEQEIKQLKKNYTKLEEKHISDIENINKSHRKDLQEIEFEMLRCVSESQKLLEEEKRNNSLKIQDIQNRFKDEICNLKQNQDSQNYEKDTRILQLERSLKELKIVADRQIKEKCDELEKYWKCKFDVKEKESSAILKECQSISEYNIIQCELEKTELKEKLNLKDLKYKDIEKKYDTIYNNYKQLQSSYSNVQNKLYRMIKELRDKEMNKQYIAHLLNEKHKYELTIDKLQNTIEVLKTRLLDSDFDVEHLKKEVMEQELKLKNCNQQCFELNEKLKEAENNNELIIEKTKVEVENVKTELFKNIDEFKETAEEKINLYKEKLVKKDEDYKLLFEQLKDQQLLNEKASEVIKYSSVELDELEKENLEALRKVNDLTIKNDKTEKLNADLREENHCLEEINSKLRCEVFHLTEKLEESAMKPKEVVQIDDERVHNLEAELEVLRNKNKELTEINEKQKKKINEQQNLILPFKEQLEAYELEMNSLQSAKSYMENEAKDLGLKYAQILGHQNQKQKIKYMVNLKTKVDELIKAKLDLEAKIRVQDKKIEKVKKENAELKKVRKPHYLNNKENSSPIRNRCESPLPLKEIN